MKDIKKVCVEEKASPHVDSVSQEYLNSDAKSLSIFHCSARSAYISQVVNFVEFPTVKEYKSPYKETQISTGTHPLHVEKHEEWRVGQQWFALQDYSMSFPSESVGFVKISTIHIVRIWV